MNYDDDNHERQFYSDNEHERLIEKFDSPVRGTYRDLDAFQVIEDGRVMVTLGVPNHRMPEEFVSAAERDEARAERDRYLDALIQMDEAICHGNPATAKRIAREAYGKKDGQGNA